MNTPPVIMNKLPLDGGLTKLLWIPGGGGKVGTVANREFDSPGIADIFRSFERCRVKN